MTDLDEQAIEAVAKVKWMREHSHAPLLVSPADLEQMWLDWRGLEIDSYSASLNETREEVAAYLAARGQRQVPNISDDAELAAVNAAYDVMLEGHGHGKELEDNFDAAQAMAMAAIHAFKGAQGSSTPEQPDEREAALVDLVRRASVFVNAVAVMADDKTRSLAWIADAALVVRDTEQQEQGYSLCGECGVVTPDAEWEGFNGDDEGKRVPAGPQDEPHWLRCPFCCFDHTDDDSDPGVWGGSQGEMTTERARLVRDGEAGDWKDYDLEPDEIEPVPTPEQPDAPLTDDGRETLIASLRPPRRALTQREESAFQAARLAVFEQRDAHEAGGRELPPYDERRIFFRAGLATRVPVANATERS